MSLYQDRQIKGFLLFLTLFALLFVGTATVLTIYQVNDAEVLSLNAFIAANIPLIHKESGWGFPLPSPLLRVKTVLSPYKVKSEKVRCLHYLSLRICKVKFTCL